MSVTTSLVTTSFVTIRPEALLAAAGALDGLGSALAAQDAAAAAATTSIAPAAADEVSALQAAQFSAYGTWYQQVSAQAKAVHQSLVGTLTSNAGSYGDTEAANQVTTSAAALPRAAAAAAADPSSDTGAALGTTIEWGQNVGAAASDFISLGAGQFAPGAGLFSTSAAVTADAGAAVPVAAAAPPAAAGAAPGVLANVGGGPSIGALSVPPGWAAGGVPAASTAPVQLTGHSAAAPPAAPVGAVPGGLPAMASTGRGGSGLGAPRYGVKPTVMPKPAV